MDMETAVACSGTINYGQHRQGNTREITDKPKRPLNAYNFFFQNERKRMLGPDFVEKKEGRRIHRRTHGKFSFGEMARIISKKWKLLDETSRSKFEQQAEQDRKRYRQQMIVWKNGENLMKHRQHLAGKGKFQQQQDGIQTHVVTDGSAHKKGKSNGSSCFTINATAPRDSSPISNTRKSTQPPILLAVELKREAKVQSDETKVTELLLPKSDATSLATCFDNPHHLVGRNGDSTYAATVSVMSSDISFSTCANACDALTALRLIQFQQEKRERYLSRELWKTTSILRNVVATPSQETSSTYLGNGNLARLSQAISTTKVNGLVHHDNRSIAVGTAITAPISVTFVHPLLRAPLLPAKAAVNGGLLGRTRTL